MKNAGTDESFTSSSFGSFGVRKPGYEGGIDRSVQPKSPALRFAIGLIG
jgi:hypothetical protein